MVNQDKNILSVNEDKPVLEVIESHRRIPGGAEGRVFMMPDFFEMPKDFMEFFDANKPKDA
jgi:hypothetical protein